MINVTMKFNVQFISTVIVTPDIITDRYSVASLYCSFYKIYKTHFIVGLLEESRRKYCTWLDTCLFSLLWELSIIHEGKYGPILVNMD